MSEETVIVVPVDLGVQDYLQGFLGKCRDRGGSSDGLGVQDYLQGFLGKCRDRGGSSDGLGVQDYLQGFLGKCRDRGGSSDGLGIGVLLVLGFPGKLFLKHRPELKKSECPSDGV